MGPSPEPVEATEPEPPLSDPLEEAPEEPPPERPDVPPDPMLEPLVEPPLVVVAICVPLEPVEATEPEPPLSEPPEEAPEEPLPEPPELPAVPPRLDAKANPSVEWPQPANITAVHAIAPAKRVCFLFRATIIQPF